MEFQDGKYHVEPEEIIAIQTDDTSTSAFIFQEEKPLIVLGGKVQDEDFELNSIEPKMIKSLNVLKGQSAIEKYGEQAENGVIEINLKTKEEVLQENEKEQNQTSENREEQNFTTESVSFKISEKKDKNGTEVKISNAHDAQFSQWIALYVVDGKKMDKDFDPDGIDPNKIESIQVI
ncbi:hypothetical protein [Salinimicrobium terrae]|uniref:hypothetical protein n=1 Tax=Salinimicrobium terrae TaxID=470866 RepID=UPI00040BB677|nr:hypothetical protein [Salinimicrobium terrae]